jgi:hypothetical protein
MEEDLVDGQKWTDQVIISSALEIPVKFSRGATLMLEVQNAEVWKP